MACFSDHCATTTITIDLILMGEVLRTYTYRVRLLNVRENTINHHVQMAEREMVSRARAVEECSKKAAEVATITQLLKRNEQCETEIALASKRTGVDIALASHKGASLEDFAVKSP
jgi:hypothetical protein